MIDLQVLTGRQNGSSDATTGLVLFKNRPLETLNQLAQLGDNWDGYGAIAPTKSALLGACNMLHLFVDAEVPVPDVFPCPNGNIQIEWSVYDLDVELEVERDDKCYFSFEDMRTGEEQELTLTYRLEAITRAVNTLKERHQLERIALVS